MKEKEPFEVEELDDQQLEDASGGAILGTDATFEGLGCPDNSGNCVRGCACPG